jgi:hypothetical protein
MALECCYSVQCKFDLWSLCWTERGKSHLEKQTNFLAKEWEIPGPSLQLCRVDLQILPLEFVCKDDKILVRDPLFDTIWRLCNMHSHLCAMINEWTLYLSFYVIAPFNPIFLYPIHGPILCCALLPLLIRLWAMTILLNVTHQAEFSFGNFLSNFDLKNLIYTKGLFMNQKMARTSGKIMFKSL